MKARWKTVLALALICASCVGLLCGCREAKASEEPVTFPDTVRFDDCPRQDTAHLKFYTPDTVTLIRDGAVVGVYAKGSDVYGEILKRNEQALQDYLLVGVTETGEPGAGKTFGMIGMVTQTDDGTVFALTEGVYLVYEYAGDAYPPVCFHLTDPEQGLSQVQSAQSDDGIYGFYTSRELLDYLSGL